MALHIKLLSIWCILYVSYLQAVVGLPHTNRNNSTHYKSVNKTITIPLEADRNGRAYDGETIAYNSLEDVLKDLQQQQQEYPSNEYIFNNNSPSSVPTFGWIGQQPDESNLRKRQTPADVTNHRTMTFNDWEQLVKGNRKVNDSDNDDLIISISSPKQFNGEQQEAKAEEEEKNPQQIDNRNDLLKLTTTFTIATTTTTATSNRSTTVLSTTATGKRPDGRLLHTPMPGAITLPYRNKTVVINRPAAFDIHVDINIHVGSNHYNNDSNETESIKETENPRSKPNELYAKYGNYDSTTAKQPTTPTATTTTTSTPTPIGIQMNDFLNLIPVDQVKAIMTYYYTTDMEVKCFYNTASQPNYYYFTSYIVTIPEIDDFLIYLKQNDFDLVGFLNSLIKILTIDTSKLKADYDLSTACSELYLQLFGQKNVNYYREELDKMLDSVAKAKISEVSPIMNATEGLDGLIESLVDILPQDQLLETFFKKVEEDPAFAHLIEQFGSETFQGHLLAIQNYSHSKPTKKQLNKLIMIFQKIFKQMKAWLPF